MKQDSMKVLFFIRKSRLKKNGEAPVFLRITINGLELNSYIEALKVRLYQIHKELLCRDALITPQNMLVKLFAVYTN